jgi:hypothetical protein
MDQLKENKPVDTQKFIGESQVICNGFSSLMKSCGQHGKYVLPSDRRLMIEEKQQRYGARKRKQDLIENGPGEKEKEKQNKPVNTGTVHKKRCLLPSGQTTLFSHFGPKPVKA